jgi:capsule polysaccharide modification protein KpsS
MLGQSKESVMSNTANRNFLFLQGPHGPFFRHLGRMLAAAGAEVWRVGFNAGDRAFWPRDASFIAYKGVPEDWQAAFSDLLDEKASPISFFTAIPARFTRSPFPLHGRAD